MSAVSDRVKEIIADRDELTPADLAVVVLNNLKLHERDALLGELLPNYLINLMGAERRRLSAIPRQREMTQWPEEARSTGGRSTGSELASRSTAPRQSQKVKGIRSWYAALLDSRCSVGGEWIRMRDLTRDNLLVMATERRKLASDTVAAAAMFEALAKELEDRKLLTVSEIGEERLKELYQL